MTEISPTNYWISNTALRITLNALSNPDYIQGSVLSGAVIIVYMKSIGDDDFFGYDAGHNYKRWTLTCSPTAFGTYTEKYIYVAIPKDTSKTQAQVVFPSEHIDLYGQNEEGTQVGSTDFYYIWLQGIISSSGDDGKTEREWTQDVNCGMLSTDEHIDTSGMSDYFEYNSVTNMITFLKTVASATFLALTATTATITNLVIDGAKFIGKAVFGTTSTSSEDTIVTPKYVDDFGNTLLDKYLRKDQDDETTHKLTMGSAEVKGDAVHDANTDFGTFNTGLTGGRIDNTGDGELRRLTLREELIVPRITYNSQEWIAGNTWRSQGGGIIKAVAVDVGNHNYAMLSLVDGEVGKIAADDKCQGIFHLSSGNSSEDLDNKNGEFTFAGFTTIYFLVTAVLTDTDNESFITVLLAQFGDQIDVPETVTTDEAIAAYKRQQIIDGMENNQFFTYVLRSSEDEKWTDATHPQPQMNFAVYANENIESRQLVNLETPSYSVYLTGMTGWTYDSDNIQIIIGNLNGFNIKCVHWDRDNNSGWVDGTESLTGEGIGIGNMYQWGNTKQLNRRPTLISQQLHYNASASADAPDKTDTNWDAQSGGKVITKASKDKPYLWGYYTYEWSDGVTISTTESTYETTSDVFLISNWAKDGAAIDMKGSVMAYYTQAQWTEELIATLSDGMYAVDQDSVAKLYQVTNYQAVALDDPAEGDSYYNIADSAIYIAKEDGWQYIGSISITTLDVVYSNIEDVSVVPSSDTIVDTAAESSADKPWHREHVDTDVWMCTSKDSGATWTSKMRIVAYESVQVLLTTNNGNVIKNGEGSTTITATVIKGNTDITSTITAFTWTRVSSDTSADTTWNTNHASSTGSTLTVSKDDINGNAMFECSINI